jgi:hypothetical protein
MDMKHKWISRISALLLLAVIALGLPSVARSQGPTPSLPLSVSATTSVAVPNASVVATLSAARHNASVPGLEDRLAQVAAAYRAGDTAKLATFRGESQVDLKNNQARVILEMDQSPNAVPVGGPSVETVTVPNGKSAHIQHAPAIAIRSDLAQAIATTGATYETAYQNLVQVLAPIGNLEALTRISGVRYVRLPYPAEPAVRPPQGPNGLAPMVGTQTSQGVSLTHANTWQTAGYNGSGVNLAVFDFGFTGWAALESSGDLPAGAVLKDFSATYSFSPDTAGNEHGAACAEIAYDMAPGATVYLYAFGTDVELGTAVNDYINNVSGKKVASMSITWVNAGPYDGTGSINTIINSAQTAGIFWANSAGSNQKQHWSGTSTQYSGGGDSIAFGGGNVEGIGGDTSHLWTIASGTQLNIFLEWNDWNSSRNGNQNHVDYDLFLLQWTGSGYTQVAQSIGDQCSTSTEPTEAIHYTVPSGGPYNYGVVIQRFATGACPNNFGHWMELHTFNGFYQTGTGAANSFQYVNQCNSITIPADGDSALAAGATFWNEDSTSPLYGLETFSGLGPRNAAGGGNPGTTVNKPDVVAPDGVNAVTYGVNNGTNYANGGGGFWGTSAAAPHVAGLAAVSWSGHPSYTLSQLVNYVKSQAIYKADGSVCGGTGDPNNRYGDGRINLGAIPAPPSTSTLFLPLVANKPCFNYFDDFSNPSSGWTSSDNSNRSIGYLNGEYQILIKTPQWGQLVTPGENQLLVLSSDYRIEVDARKASANTGTYGLDFSIHWVGNSADSYYQLLVGSNSQRYLLEKRLSGTWTTLIDWTYSAAIQPGTASNHLRVDRIGTAIYIYINSSLVATYSDSSLTGAGYDAGVRAYSGDTSPVDMRFDNFRATCAH